MAGSCVMLVNGCHRGNGAAFYLPNLTCIELYTVLSVLLVACYVRAQASDGNGNSQASNQGKGLTANDMDDVVNWVKKIIQNDSETGLNTGNKLNLNPTTLTIKNISFSRPGQPANQNSDEDNSTPHPETPCTGEDGIKGVCVMYYQCDVETLRVIGDGKHLYDLRSGSNTRRRDCPHNLEVCCQLEHRVREPSQTTGSAVVLHPPKLIKDDMSTGLDIPTVKRKLQQECGWNRPELFQPPNEEVADSGVYAKYGEFPWMVALMRKSKTKVWVQDDYIGGGSLIHPSVVMTAKHNLLKVTAAQLKCRAGEWNTQTDMEKYGIQERDADRIVSHPDFYLTSSYYDVALIFLKEPFELAGAPHIGTACLAPVLPDKGTCFGMGWGKDVKYKENFHILKKVRLSLVEHESCQEMLHKNTRFRLNPFFVLHESLTCAGGQENVDTCEGDGGSPLVCQIGNSKGRTRYAVVGIVAYGLGCGVKNVPGVYANVPHVYTWVLEQMADNNCTSDTFTY